VKSNSSLKPIPHQRWLLNFWALRDLDLLAKYKSISGVYLELDDLERDNILEDLDLKYYHPLSLSIMLRPRDFDPAASVRFVDEIYGKITTIVDEQRSANSPRDDGTYLISVPVSFPGSGPSVDIFIDDNQEQVADSIKHFAELRIPDANGRDTLILTAYEDFSRRHLKIRKTATGAGAAISPTANGIDIDYTPRMMNLEASLSINSASTLARDLPQLLNVLNFLRDLA
jgi:hypothetical protein